jgi:hypothetical protein
MQIFLCASAHTPCSAVRARSDSKYGPNCAFVPQYFMVRRAPCNTRVQLSRFQKHPRSGERALTLRTC